MSDHPQKTNGRKTQINGSGPFRRSCLQRSWLTNLTSSVPSYWDVNRPLPTLRHARQQRISNDLRTTSCVVVRLHASLHCECDPSTLVESVSSQVPNLKKRAWSKCTRMSVAGRDTSRSSDSSVRVADCGDSIQNEFWKATERENNLATTSSVDSRSSVKNSFKIL